MPELLRKASIRTGGNRAVHVDQQHQARCSFHLGAHGRAIAGAFQHVAFPVTGDGLGGDVGGRSVSGVMLGIWPRRSWPRTRWRRALQACHKVVTDSLRSVSRGNTYSAVAVVSGHFPAQGTRGLSYSVYHPPPKSLCRRRWCTSKENSSMTLWKPGLDIHWPGHTHDHPECGV